MSLIRTIEVALKALRRNPTRALLTALGIVIGTYSSICISPQLVSLWPAKEPAATFSMPVQGEIIKDYSDKEQKNTVTRK